MHQLKRKQLRWDSRQNPQGCSGMTEVGKPQLRWWEPWRFRAEQWRGETSARKVLLTNRETACLTGQGEKQKTR